MSKKDFDDYYNKICSDYSEMLETLKDMEEASLSGLVSPEQLDEIKKLIIPLKDNYMTVSWIKFLLNKPTRDKKANKYKNSNKKFISTLNVIKNPKNILNQDKNILNELKTKIK